jgi:hypothetical protein
MAVSYTHEELIDLNQRADAILSSLGDPPLPAYLAARLHPSLNWRFHFTGFKRPIDPDVQGLTGQFVVAISVPEKPPREGDDVGWAFWYNNVPQNGPPKLYEFRRGEYGPTNTLMESPISDNDLRSMLVQGRDYLAKMLVAAY